jgi:hypothetical protein
MSYIAQVLNLKMIKHNIPKDKNNIRLDLSDFNASLVEMLGIIKDKNLNFQNIMQFGGNSDTDECVEVFKKEEEEVDLSKLKLNIQALKEAVQIAKKQKKSKN